MNRATVAITAARTWVGCAASVLAVAACSTDDGGPRLQAVVPTSAAHAAMVELTGTRLCGGGDCSDVPAQIALGIDPPMVAAQVVSYSDTSATFVVPELVPAGDTAIIVTVGDESSNALAFEVLP